MSHLSIYTSHNGELLREVHPVCMPVSISIIPTLDAVHIIYSTITKFVSIQFHASFAIASFSVRVPSSNVADTLSF